MVSAQRVKCLPAMWETQVQSLHQEDPLEKEMEPTPVLLLGKFHGQRSLVSYSPWGCKELDTTERLHFTSHSTRMSFQVICVCLVFALLKWLEECLKHRRPQKVSAVLSWTDICWHLRLSSIKDSPPIPSPGCSKRPMFKSANFAMCIY